MPLVPAKAGTQSQVLDSRFRGNEREDYAFPLRSFSHSS
jgi:hypothetical protein